MCYIINVMFKRPKLKIVNYDSKRHTSKNSVEKLNDLFFILFVLLKGEEKNIPVTTGILIKTLFTTQISLVAKIKFLHTGFYPYEHGPFNKSFYSYLDELDSTGLIKKEGYNLSLTTKGSSLLQPIFEEAKKQKKEYTLIEDELEIKLEECKHFFATSDKLHNELLIDEISEDKNIIKMQDAIDDFRTYNNTFIESTEEEGEEFVLPDKVINKLLDVSAGITRDDYSKRIVVNDSMEFFEMLK